ncbi:MAG: helix-turn-helix domain-containing protein [Bacteroidaceae bacterium]|nr:helix-turn-helix domain-containing protein [Bacteroidaceae bacterium]
MEDCGYGVRLLTSFDAVTDHPVEVDYFAMSLCTSGTASVTVNLDKYSIKSSDMLFFAPNDFVHIEAATVDFAMKQIYVTSVDLIREAATHILSFIKDVDSSRTFFIRERESYSKGERIMADFCTIYDFLSLVLANENSTSKYEQGVCIFRCLLLALRDKISARYRQGITESVSSALGYFNRFVILLSEQCKEHHEVSYYAGELHVTAQYLGRICRKYDGRGAKEIITDTLILQMKSTIKNTEKSLKEISYEYNFPNFSFMSRFFRRYTGITPSEFRAGYREGAQ